MNTRSMRHRHSSSRRLARAFASALVLVAAGCGSISLPPDGQTGGSAGTGGSGPAGSGGSPGTGGTGSGTGGAAGTTGAGGASCTFEGKVYPNGVHVDATGCRNCTCSDGQLACLPFSCPPPQQSCGGLLGLACPTDTYCAFPESAHCGAADQTGLCTHRPEVCPDIFSPVCGCDDKTYGNACEAGSAGVSVVHTGACAPPTGSCTVDGVTYPDGAGGIPAADGCNICACAAGSLRCTLRACPAPKSCGARAGNSCTINEYCAYTEGAYCGAADAQSVCKVRPTACDQVYAPVCGCDNKTYGNACSAALAGSGVLHAGPCSGAGRSCLVGGVTYPDGAKMPAADGCNTCNCADGQLACTARACEVTRFCGDTLSGAGCLADEFCAWAVGQNCGRADGGTTCSKRPEICTTQFDPVCACNGTTYGNACEAARAGFGVDHAGPCVN